MTLYIYEIPEEDSEFHRYVKQNCIVEKKKLELHRNWDRYELEACKLIYCRDPIPSDDDIKKLVEKQHKDNVNNVNDIISWELGYCLLDNRPK